MLFEFFCEVSHPQKEFNSYLQRFSPGTIRIITEREKRGVSIDDHGRGAGPLLDQNNPGELLSCEEKKIVIEVGRRKRAAILDGGTGVCLLHQVAYREGCLGRLSERGRANNCPKEQTREGATK